MAAIKTPTEEAKKVLTIIQLTRLGDLIQTAQAARLLKEEHPNIEVNLVARKQFATPLNFALTKVFDNIVVLDTDKIFRKQSTLCLEKCIQELKSDIGKINALSTDVSINLSFSKPSNYLHSLIKSNHKVGPYYNTQAQVVIEDKWSQYLSSSVLDSDMNPYNLVDLYKNIIGVKSNKFTKAKESKKSSILVHPFASQDRKHWKPSKWAEVLFKVLKDNSEVDIKIVGAKADIVNYEKIVSNPLLNDFKTRIKSYVGKNSLEEVYALLGDDTLFVGHDSAISHMAALKGTQSLTISLANARALETAPYSLNNYIIAPRTKCYPCTPQEKCDFYQCHKDIPYQVVTEAISSLLSGEALTQKELEKKTSQFHLSSIDVLKTQQSENGLIKLNNLIDHNSSIKGAMQEFYRMAWLYSINEVEEGCSFPTLTDSTYNGLVGIKEGMRQAFELCEFGKKYSRYILEEISSKTPDINQIKSFSEKIDEIDNLIGIINNTYPMLKPITNYLTLRKSNLHGTNLVELSESSFLAFNEASMLISIIYELTEKTLQNYKKNKIPSTKELR